MKINRLLQEHSNWVEQMLWLRWMLGSLWSYDRYNSEPRLKFVKKTSKMMNARIGHKLRRTFLTSIISLFGKKSPQSEKHLLGTNLSFLDGPGIILCWKILCWANLEEWTTLLPVIQWCHNLQGHRGGKNAEIMQKCWDHTKTEQGTCPKRIYRPIGDSGSPLTQILCNLSSPRNSKTGIKTILKKSGIGKNLEIRFFLI